jgi:hypothetical protein
MRKYKQDSDGITQTGSKRKRNLLLPTAAETNSSGRVKDQRDSTSSSTPKTKIDMPNSEGKSSIAFVKEGTDAFQIQA